MDIVDAHLRKVANSPQCFDVELSKVLKDYLGELNKNVTSQKSLLNFTRAAFLVQHTANVYGRNVDFLYQSVLELQAILNSFVASDSRAVIEEPRSLSTRLTNVRRRTNVVPLSIEDFQLLDEEPDSQPRKRKGKKQSNTKEPAFSRLIRIKKDISGEHSIYDDNGNDSNFVNIGRKDEFRLNWPVNQDYSLNEDILDQGSEISWTIFDDRVVNIPTPDYSNDGGVCSTPIPEHGDNLYPFSQANLNFGITSPNHVPDDQVPIANRVENFDGESIVNSPCKPDEAVENPPVNIPNSPVHNENPPVKVVPCVFKLPHSLKGQINVHIKNRNLTAFMFSSLLKRSLRMKGVLPKFKDKKTDDELVKKHVKNIMKKYNLENPNLLPNPDSLTLDQSDFLGFDPVDTPEVEDIFDSHFFDDSSEEIRLAQAIGGADVCVRDSMPEHFRPVTPALSECGDYFPQGDLDVLEQPYHNNAHIGNNEDVVQWQSSIQGVLKQMALQRPFNVHTYCTDIINSFSFIGETILFANLTRGCFASEVSRYFMSCLMLANTENVRLENDGCPDTLKLTLLSRDRHRELEEYLACGLTSITETSQLPSQQRSRDNITASHVTLTKLSEQPLQRKNKSLHRNRTQFVKSMQPIKTNVRQVSITSTQPPAKDVFLTPRGSSVSNRHTSLGIAQCDVCPGTSGLVFPCNHDSTLSSTPSSHASSTKRTHVTMEFETDLDESLSRDCVKEKRGFCKQKPGTGPWVNKSKKAKKNSDEEAEK